MGRLPVAAAAGCIVVAGCGGSPAHGSVTGRLLHQTSPTVPGYYPIPGTIIAISKAGRRFTATTDAQGHYTLTLEVGIYRVIGHSPKYPANVDCLSANVSIKSGEQVSNDVYCYTP